MHTSRDVLRPLVALLVVVAAVALVSNVAAYRALATESHDQLSTVPATFCATSHAQGDFDSDADSGATHSSGTCQTGSSSASNGGGVTVVTNSGAS